MDNLLPANAGERRTLADLILSKFESGGQDNSTVVKATRRGRPV